MAKEFDYPRVYLAIDNCFASKRWTNPSEWAKLIKSIGLNYIEASADNECDPLYNGSKYLVDWIENVKKAEKKERVKIINLYSGHGTYSTLGLGHNIVEVHDRILNKWLKTMIRVSSNLGAGLGFYCHAFDQRTLQNQNLYYKAIDNLYNDFVYLAKYASKKDLHSLSVEQMYSPNQIPWTIKGALALLKEVYRRSSYPFYITTDVGHQCCQKNYQMPTYDIIKKYLQYYREGNKISKLWLGPESAYKLFTRALSETSLKESEIISKIIKNMKDYPYMFTNNEDGNPYNWLSNLGCWSPIIHLQQTNGTTSAHKPFTDEYNKTGIINGGKVLDAIAKSYKQAEMDSMPKVCKEIYLTIEVFSETGAMPIDIINNLKDTIKYWRYFVPEDGLALSKILKN